uniref:Kinesin motor domain-containing protein n=1 Tax=Leersia perrieri TaxID=77586 RepID=A0A0D9XAI3_9ORYZ
MGAAEEEAAAAWDKAAEAKEERIMVSVRLRPLNGRESGDTCDWECISPTTVMFRSTIPERAMFPTAYTYDRVFGPDSSTRQVYEEGAKEVALSVVSGINSSIFAYGQTSSGKTYTMTGITEYSVLDIYDYIEKHPEREFILRFSAIEIYNEAVRDLLSHDTTPLRLLDDPEKGTTVEKLTEETLRDKDHLRDLLAVCEAQRQIGETALNETSSRSHQILRLTIESSARQYLGRGNSSTLVACVNFVDLAGSERASQTASAGVRLKEGSHINRSLLTLGKVVRQLSKGRNGHIPYRDSKLTRILQSSLGGNARTAIICTMSPARTHIEQSRNTLLFATCAKEVVTNAQVNVVMSDKALVKHLQRELARLESEMKTPGPASCTNHAEALREKDAQIKKLEKQLKELMEERDTVKSQLDCLLLKSDSDDLRDERITNRWDEHSRSSESFVRNASEEAFSVSDTCGIAYQDQDHVVFNGSCAFSDDREDIVFPVQTVELPEETKHEKCRSRWQPPSHHNSSDCIDSYHMTEAASRTASEVSEENCREVQCIDIHENRRSTSHEFDLLLPQPQDTKLQTPELDISKESVPQPDEEQELESITSRMEDPIRMYTINEEQQDEIPYPYECLTVKRCVMSSKDSVLSRSKSCRASFMIIPNSWFDDNECIGGTPPDEIFKHTPRKPDKVRRSLYPENVNPSSVDRSVLPSELSFDEALEDMSNSDEVAKDMCLSDAEQGNLISGISFATRLEKTDNEDEDKLEYQDQQSVRDGSTTMRTVKDVGIDSTLSTIDSPSRSPIDFENMQQEIIQLWHECNVPIVHRTYFFLLFKGDPADNIYMEVEHRRLSFIRRSFSARPAVEGELNSAVASSLKNLRRERDTLHKQMLKKLNNGEKESVYARWGIDLSSKQRRLQLSRLVWTQTDMEHIRESASLVARLIELLEPAQALKEMFGLNFTLAPRADRRSFSLLGI